MKRGIFIGFMFAAIMLVSLGSVAYAHHRPGHSGEPGGGGGLTGTIETIDGNMVTVNTPAGPIAGDYRSRHDRVNIRRRYNRRP